MNTFQWAEGEKKFSLEDAIGVICNLIFCGGVKGYCHYERKKMVFHRQDPFPDPKNWISAVNKS